MAPPGKTDHTAAGQALGFGFQFARATYRLLSAGSGVVSVGVELVDDVSEQRSDGTSTREQDKLTTSERRPLTDRSEALWKTLSIWAEHVAANPACLGVTEFHLVTNGEVSPQSLAARIHKSAGDPEIARELRALVADLRPDLAPFGAAVCCLPEHDLARLTQHIYVFDRTAPEFGGKLEDVPMLHLLAPIQRVAIFDGARGWVERTVLAAAKAGEPTTVDRASFDREVKALFRRVQIAPLAAVFDPSGPPGLVPSKYRKYGFFQQLEWVDVDDDYARECVINYAQARAIRTKWAEAPDAVSEAALKTYESELKSRWKLKVASLSRRKYQTCEEKGHELLIETLCQDVPIDGQDMPRQITCGNYHALADFSADREPQLGWHPDYGILADRSRGAK